MTFRNERIGHFDLKGSAVDSSKALAYNDIGRVWEENFCANEVEQLIQAALEKITLKNLAQIEINPPDSVSQERRPDDQP